MHLISKYNKGVWLCVIDIHSKYVWAVPLKDKKTITITNEFPNFFGWIWSQNKQIMVAR